MSTSIPFQITPFFLGSGKAALALRESLRIVELLHPEFEILPARSVPRGKSLPEMAAGVPHPVLFIANPHALHADAILQGERAGFEFIFCEKPAAVTPSQIQELRRVKVPVAVCHVYRNMWGIQKLRSLVDAGELGELIAIEGRYWQCSAAQKALLQDKPWVWKNDPSLSGPHDVLIDIGSHWADAAIFLAGGIPEKTSLWKSYQNAEAPHRDTHLHLSMQFSSGARAQGSISKTVHGSPNHFEINLIGTKKFASWKFATPDRIELSEGANTGFLTRTETKYGSGHWAYHGLGWVEGYVEIIRQGLLGLRGEGASFPSLSESLDVLDVLMGSADSMDSIRNI